MLSSLWIYAIALSLFVGIGGTSLYFSLMQRESKRARRYLKALQLLSVRSLNAQKHASNTDHIKTQIINFMDLDDLLLIQEDSLGPIDQGTYDNIITLLQTERTLIRILPPSGPALIARLMSNGTVFGFLLALRQKAWNNQDHRFLEVAANTLALAHQTPFQQNKKPQGPVDTLIDEASALSPLWYWTTDHDNLFTFLSKNFTGQTGIPIPYALGRLWPLPHDNRPLSAVERDVFNAITHHKTFKDFTTQLTYLGKRISVTLSGSAYFDSQGAFAGYRGIGLISTEQDPLLERLQDSLEHYPHGVIIWDNLDRLAHINRHALVMMPFLKQFEGKGVLYQDMIAKLSEDDIINTVYADNDDDLQTLLLAHKKGGIRVIHPNDDQTIRVEEYPTQEGGIIGIYMDMSAEEETRNKNQQNTAITEALNQSRKTLYHARNETFILSELCRISVEILGFTGAWIHPVAPSGLADYIDILQTSGFPLGLRSCRVTSTLKQVYLKKEPLILSSSVLLHTYEELRPYLLPHDLQSAGIFPIAIESSVVGLLCVVSKNAQSFSDAIKTLLNDLCQDAGYGISTLRSDQNRQDTEQALRESESRYRSVVDMSPDAILVLDHHNNIIFANPSGHTLFSPDNRHELFNRDFTDFIKDESFVDRFSSPTEAHTSRQFSSIALKKADHTTIEADITERPVIYDGQTTRLLIIRDVTQHNRVRAQLNQTSKLATLGEMAAGITHELSQPLNIMRFAAEGSLLKIDRGEADLSTVKKQFDLISVQSARMADIIDHMRIFSRKDTGTIEIFDPALAIRRSVDMVEAQFLNEDIHMEVRYPPYYEPIKGRPVQLEQVILNLVTNARDAINERRNQDPDLSEIMRIDITMTFDQADDRIRIAITDTGGGIPEQALNRLFDPFFTTKEVGKGTGLGLSVSYGIISAMEGTIQARNIHGGARFDMTLPCTNAPLDTFTEAKLETTLTPSLWHDHTSMPALRLDEMEEDAIDLPDNLNGYNVLVVDDEVYAAEAMMEYLFSHGYHVHLAGDGLEAIDVFEAESIDIVITDIRMPRMNGHDLVNYLKDRAPDLPIIVVTGHSGTSGGPTAHALERMVYRVLKKPLSLSDLVNEVDRAIQDHAITREK